MNGTLRQSDQNVILMPGVGFNEHQIFFKEKLFFKIQIKTINHGLWVLFSAMQINLCSIKCIVVQRYYFFILMVFVPKETTYPHPVLIMHVLLHLFYMLSLLEMN